MGAHQATEDPCEEAQGTEPPPWSPVRYHYPQVSDHLDEADWPKLGTAPTRGKEGPHPKMRPAAAAGPGMPQTDTQERDSLAGEREAP